MTVPAAASVFTGKPAPNTIGAIARGLLAEPYPLAQVNAARTMPTQDLLGVLVPVQAGMVISGVAVCVSVVAANGSLPTGVFLGITDLTGVRLGITADSKAVALWNATGVTSFALTTAYSVTTDGAVYACIVKNGVWGTEGQITTMTGVTGSGKAFGANAPMGVKQASQTTVPTTATWVANDSFPWIALV